MNGNTVAASTIFTEFLLLLATLFFLPRLLERWIPHPISEVLIGIVVAVFVPTFFTNVEVIEVLASIGIITLFVYAGLEADTQFIVRHKKVFIENVLLFVGLVLVCGYAIYYLSAFNLQVSLLLSLALLTPSASYILSITKKLSSRERQWIEGQALAAEISAILLMVGLLGSHDLMQLAITFGILVILVLLVPVLLNSLYKHLFSKLVGTEFSFIFVIALGAALITDHYGMHFLVGAFIAGLVSQAFIARISADRSYKQVTKKQAQSIIEGFGFFASVFAPFFFFSTGLLMHRDMFTWKAIGIGVVLVCVLSIVRAAITYWHRQLRLDEKIAVTTRVSTYLLPTLVFTFVIAGILYSSELITQSVFGVLLLYGILVSLVPLLLTVVTKSNPR
jgi:Kef-type K+ transport system membrane component KefB